MTTEVSVAYFKKCFPEFAVTDNGECEAKLAMAARQVNSTAFGNSAVDAIMLKAAHLLSIAPAGQQARLRIANRGTLYETEFDKLAANKLFGVGRTI